MKQQIRRIRTVYVLLTLLAVLLPMSGWYARALTKPVISDMPRALRADDPGICMRDAIYTATLKVDTNVRR